MPDSTVAQVVKPVMLDETGRAIVDAILSTDVTQARISEINAAAQTATQGITELQTSALETIGNNIRLGNESITTASEEAVTAIETKKTQVLAEISGDYTELNNKVTQLSNDVADLKEALIGVQDAANRMTEVVGA